MKENKRESLFLISTKQLLIIFLIILLISFIQGDIYEFGSYSCINDNFDIKFTLSEYSHSGWESKSNCLLRECNQNLNDKINCQSSSIPCYRYYSFTGKSYCAPGILCSILESCNINYNNCSSNNSICIINSCCSSSKGVCLPLIFTNFCILFDNISYSKDTTTIISIQSTKIIDEKETNKNILFTNATTSLMKITSENIQTTEIIKSSEKVSITTYPNKCEERELIDDKISKMINVIPNDLSIEEKLNFQSTSIRGVSFPENNLKPIIIIDFGISTQIKSIIIPRNKTINANVQQFQVTFYSLNANKINPYPILSYLTSINNKNIPIEINSTDIPLNISILWIELTIIRTIDNTSPKGLILDIKGCSQIFNNEWISWTNTRNMNDPRYDHTSSLLLNGKVLVSGGTNGNIYLNTCELYDPLSKYWIKISNMNYQRSFHQATLLRNGNILITGGSNSIYYFLNSSELFNSTTNNFIKISNMNYQRGMHTQTLLNNGNILISGGFNGLISLKYSEIYNSITSNYTITTNMNYQRHYHTASLLNNGKVFITGGFNNITALNYTELYDPLTTIWQITNNMKYNRYWHTASIFKNGKVFITGGYDGYNSLNTTELYDPLIDKWINTANMNYQRYQHTANILNNGNILVTGGYNGINQLNSTELYDTLNNKWIIVGYMNYQRYRHTSNLLTNQRILINGGQFILNSISASELSF